MGSIFDRIAEQRIAEAQRRGEFRDVPRLGQPLELEDLSRVPAELRAAYLVLKNAGYVPEELGLKRELLSLDDLLAACHDGDERRRLRDARDTAALKLDLLVERRGASSALHEYEPAIRERLSG